MEKRAAVDNEFWAIVTQTMVDEQLEQLIAGLAAECFDSTELAGLPTIEPLIHGIYGRHSVVILAGRNGTYKTFIAFDWACCHATGKPWLDLSKVEPGRVLFLAGEGAYGLGDRKAAWEQHYQTEVPPGMLTILPRVPTMFRNHQEVRALTEFIRRGAYTLVVIDTLRRASSGAKENANDDMGEVIDVIEKLKHATDNGSVLVLAHTDADDGKVRGATSIEDDVDVVYRTKRDGQRIKLWRTKNKYGEEQDVHYLKPVTAANSVVVERDETTTLRFVDKDRAEAKLLYNAIAAASGTLRGHAKLRGHGVDNNRIKSALQWLQAKGLVEIHDRTTPHEYVILKEWADA